MSLAVTSSNFSQEVLEFSGYVLVDFWANWCGPCQMLTPVIEEIEKENKVKVVKVDIDKDSQLAQKYNVNSIPTVLIFKNGQLQKNIIGFHSKQEYLSSISST
ncbi:thioredoxin [Candidatus Shapirobacteria bacterium RIFOXYD1_FULL_38_32]|uniref:Thioredoxin n=2 Tax=Patescibacteria group TaxID=1783273 RepID=A0A0G0K2L9_9BACT|nr:MAG: Thioredoxin [Candidatus Shapirobacteria bacterium GW2011_GWE2_38_30]OGJ06452.1 MAG: thioredoxin [Candidatus Nomurabacteria bacterium RIFOXYA1_FULL_35_17]OGL58381.1 MAG: thioredoxin [Candidatus Shapirobacteria bacterium RIFOXYD1_FULL_38_32]HAP37459.1 thioredoxin [Candidatus Shapirobacteria bacterium]HCU55241.1 thioredoxin [Candidatus Shapirobacteria bacterium]